MIKKNLKANEIAIRMVLEDAEKSLTLEEITKRVNKLRVNGALLYLVDNGVLIANLNENNVMTFIHKDNIKNEKS